MPVVTPQRCNTPSRKARPRDLRDGDLGQHGVIANVDVPCNGTRLIADLEAARAVRHEPLPASRGWPASFVLRERQNLHWRTRRVERESRDHLLHVFTPGRRRRRRPPSCPRSREDALDPCRERVIVGMQTPSLILDEDLPSLGLEINLLDAQRALGRCATAALISWSRLRLEQRRAFATPRARS